MRKVKDEKQYNRDTIYVNDRDNISLSSHRTIKKFVQ